MNSPQNEFPAWFTRFASRQDGAAIAPREWQEALARDESPRSRVIRIPTGYGKTLGVLGAWLYHRVERKDDRWPRRLVWTLPMRVLVEQTADEVRRCLDRLHLLWQPNTDHRGKVGVHLLMGGVDQVGEWNLYPEEHAVFIATQDMALSRALNRGYAAPRARWPMEFGLLSHDVLWVLDEVQLMDVGLATSAQLQAFFDDDAEAGRSLRPRLSWWMSATLQPDWLKSVDTEALHAAWTTNPTTLSPNALGAGLAIIKKALEIENIAANDSAVFARSIKDVHERSPENGEYGRITLVVCNTVDRATRTYEALEKLGVTSDLRLVHSRYRPHQRAAWKTEFLGREACKQGVDRIIVATQVVEAGVDISATTLVTELSPWSSLVQRFGRCARYGGSGSILVVERGHDDKTALPYSPEELQASKWAIGGLAAKAGDVSIATIEAFEKGLTDEQRKQLYPYQPKQLLLRRELDELFDTTPDLTGADIDVSPFIRSGDERDVSVFWLDVPPAKRGEHAPAPSKDRKPSREELCSIPFLAARDWLCGKTTKEKPASRLLPSRRAWVWDWIEGEWKVAERVTLIPGAVICVAADTGGYRDDRGFDPESKALVTVLSAPTQAAQDAADNLEDTEELSATTTYRTIATHNTEVGQLAMQIAVDLVPKRIAELIELAGRWHDLGKAHPAFQAVIVTRGPYRARVDLAKAPDGAWQTPCVYRSANGEIRRGFRHELASCLALFALLQRYEPTHSALLGPWVEALALLGEGEVPVPVAEGSEPTKLEKQVLSCTAAEFDLLAYLVLSHHGKVRVALHAGPKDQEYVARDDRGLPIRGVREGDTLPAISLDGVSSLPALSLTLAPAALGLSPLTGRSWRDRTVALLRTHGPGSLAYLEAILIAADRRASKLTDPDPLLAAAMTEGFR
ncbi:MAG: CRISPR-associated helicase Cas3' [Burkholderiales bacterium]|nr:CRISPR-associated helicase Cas3' [Burkholderiales bacterium]